MRARHIARAGTLCDVSVEFTPQSAGSLSASIVVTNNSLNLTPRRKTSRRAVPGSAGRHDGDSGFHDPTAVNLGQALTLRRS